MLTAALVGLFGIAGALVRFAVDSAFARRPSAADPQRHFPWATLCVNVAGSLLIGAAAAMTISSGLAQAWQTGLTVGLAGSLTTFSSWSVATIRLLEERRLAAAIVNLGTNLILGLAAAALGWSLVG